MQVRGTERAKSEEEGRWDTGWAESQSGRLWGGSKEVADPGDNGDRCDGCHQSSPWMLTPPGETQVSASHVSPDLYPRGTLSGWQIESHPSRTWDLLVTQQESGPRARPQWSSQAGSHRPLLPCTSRSPTHNQLTCWFP